MWFWQMEGVRWGRDGSEEERWGLDGASFDVAKRAWRRLAATEEERRAETEMRYDRAHDADSRLSDEQQRAVQEARQAEQARDQKRRARDVADGARSVRAALVETKRRRDPIPRFAMLRALRALAERRDRLLYARSHLQPTEPVSDGGVWCSFHGAGTSSLMQLDLPELDDTDALAARVLSAGGSDIRPAWADWWPSPQDGSHGCRQPVPASSWASQQLVAARRGWDGSWAGRDPSGILDPSHTELNAYRWRADTLRLAFVQLCLPPSRLPPLLTEPTVPDELWELAPEDMSSEQQRLLLMWQHIATYNCIIREYVQCYNSLEHGTEATGASELPTLAAGAHAWAPSVLQQMLGGERPRAQIADGKWSCDFRAVATFSLEIEPAPPPPKPPPLPSHIAAIAETCDANGWKEWAPEPGYTSELKPAPYVEELSAHFHGQYHASRPSYSDASKTIPASFRFGDLGPRRLLPPKCQPPAPRKHGTRPVSRIRLSLTPCLFTRGSHCRLDCGEIVGGDIRDREKGTELLEWGLGNLVYSSSGAATAHYAAALRANTCDCHGPPPPPPSPPPLPQSPRSPVPSMPPTPPLPSPPPLQSHETEVVAVLRYAADRKAELARQVRAAREEHERRTAAAAAKAHTNRLSAEKREAAEQAKKDAKRAKVGLPVRAMQPVRAKPTTRGKSFCEQIDADAIGE